jgi:hypothetical protein
MVIARPAEVSDRDEEQASHYDSGDLWWISSAPISSPTRKASNSTKPRLFQSLTCRKSSSRVQIREAPNQILNSRSGRFGHAEKGLYPIFSSALSSHSIYSTWQLTSSSATWFKRPLIPSVSPKYETSRCSQINAGNAPWASCF